MAEVKRRRKAAAAVNGSDGKLDKKDIDKELQKIN